MFPTGLQTTRMREGRVVPGASGTPSTSTFPYVARHRKRQQRIRLLEMKQSLALMFVDVDIYILVLDALERLQVPGPGACVADCVRGVGAGPGEDTAASPATVRWYERTRLPAKVPRLPACTSHACVLRVVDLP
jgi:hypothetical protein